jgi:deoxyribonuclease V
MEIRHLHPWDVPFEKAIEIQKRLRRLLTLSPLPGAVTHVAGLDVAFSKTSGHMWGGAVILTFPELVKKEEIRVKAKMRFPYIPGLLSFREIPVLLEVIMRLKIDPDIFLCDGQGTAHPRGLGLASHLGLWIDRPTIGCAKTALVGAFPAVGDRKGDWVYLHHHGRVVGAVLRTRAKVKPVFVSPGNRITLSESVNIVLRCCLKWRIPEPIRQAHLLVNTARREENS